MACPEDRADAILPGVPPEPTTRRAVAAILEPPAQTIEALVASIQAKREAKRSAALKAWERKTPTERKAWVAKLGRGPKAGARKSKAKK